MHGGRAFNRPKAGRTFLYRCFRECEECILVALDRERHAPQECCHQCRDRHIGADAFLFVRGLDLEAAPGETDDEPARIEPFLAENPCVPCPEGC